jgi:hypothetical protein
VEGSYGIDAANDLTAAVGGVGLADVGKGIGITEDLEGLFQFGEVVRAHDDRGRASVTGDPDPIMLALDPVEAR